MLKIGNGLVSYTATDGQFAQATIEDALDTGYLFGTYFSYTLSEADLARIQEAQNEDIRE